MLALTCIHLATTHIGYRLIGATAKERDLEQLLHLKDNHVVVMDSKNQSILAESKARWWGDSGNDNLIYGSAANKEMMDASSKIFASMDNQTYKKHIYSSEADPEKAVAYLESMKDFKSLKELLGERANQQIYKVLQENQSQHDLESDQAHHGNANRYGLFVRMRKKPIEFMGRPSIAFTFQNVTSKIEETISKLEKQEAEKKKRMKVC